MKKAVSIGIIILFILSMIGSFALASAEITKDYNETEKTISIKDNYTNNQVNFTLLDNTDYCSNYCYANITGESTHDVFLFENLSFYDKENQVKQIGDYNITIRDDKGKIISEKVKFKGKFNIFIEGYKEIKETFDWILEGVMGFDLSEWAWWQGVSEIYDEINDSSINTSIWTTSTSGCAFCSVSEDADDITAYVDNSGDDGSYTYFSQAVLNNSGLDMDKVSKLIINVASGYNGGSCDGDLTVNRIYKFGATPVSAGTLTFTRNYTGSNLWDRGGTTYTLSGNDIFTIRTEHICGGGACGPCATGTDFNYVYYETLDAYVALISPADGSSATSNNAKLNCSVDILNGEGIENVSLYHNATGTWHLNETINLSATNPTSYNASFEINLTDPTSIIWNCLATDNSTAHNSSFSSSNFTLNVGDITNPQITINSPSTSESTNNISMNFTFTDNVALDYCSYNVTTSGLGVEVAENEINCSNAIEYQTISDGTGYILNIFSNDTSGNSNITSLVFDIDTAVTPPPAGGGGGGGTTVIISGDKGWSMEVSDGIDRFEADMSKKSKRTFKIQFENLGESSRTITLSCEDVSGLACQYVEFPRETFELALLKDTKQTIDFIINIPSEAEKGEYQFNIRAMDDQSRDGAVTMFLGIGTLSLIPEFISKVIFSSTSGGFPYFLIFFPALIFGFIISPKIFKKEIPLRAIWILLSSVLLGVIGVWIF